MLQSPFVTQFGIFAVEVGWPILAVFARVGLFPSIPFSVSISAPHLGGQRNRYRQGISVRASKTAKIAVELAGHLMATEGFACAWSSTFS